MSEDMGYRPKGSYGWMVALGLLVALLFAWEMGQRFAWATLFFLVVALGFAIANLGWAATRIELRPTGMTVHRPLAADLSIDFRQIATVTEAGRFSPGITLVYYPVDERMGIDLDNPRSLFLPSLACQDEFLQIIQNELVE